MATNTLGSGLKSLTNMVLNNRPVDAPKSTTPKSPKITAAAPAIPTSSTIRIDTSGVKAPGEEYITQDTTYQYDRILDRIGVNVRWKRLGRDASVDLDIQTRDLVDVSAESDNVQSNFDVIQQQFVIVSNFMIGVDGKITALENSIKKGLADVVGENLKSQSKIVSQVNTQLETFDDNMDALSKRIDDQGRQIDEMFAQSKKNDAIAEQLKKSQEQTALSKEASRKSEPAKIVKKDEAGSGVMEGIEELFEDYLLYKGGKLVLGVVTRAFPWVAGLGALYALYQGGAFDPLFNVRGDASRAGKPHSWWEKFTGSETRDNLAGMREARDNKNKPEKDEDVKLPLRYIAGDVIKVEASDRLVLKGRVIRIEADRIEWVVKQGSPGGATSKVADPKDGIVGGTSETATGNDQSVLGYLGSKISGYFGGQGTSSGTSPSLLGLGQRMGQLERFHNTTPMGAETMYGKFGPGFHGFGNGLIGSGRGGGGGGNVDEGPPVSPGAEHANKLLTKYMPQSPNVTDPFRAHKRANLAAGFDKLPDREKAFMYRAMQAEGDVQKNFEQLSNYAEARGMTLDRALHSGFFGPVNRGAVSHRPLSAAEQKKFDAITNAWRNGSNVIGDRTDQGMPGDPNYAKEHASGRYRPMGPFADHPMFDNYKKSGLSWAQLRAREEQQFKTENPELYKPKSKVSLTPGLDRLRRMTAFEKSGGFAGGGSYPTQSTSNVNQTTGGYKGPIDYTTEAAKAGVVPRDGDFKNEGHLASGLIIHHTGGRGNVNSVLSTFRQRGYPAQYVMERDGTVYRTLPQGSIGRQIMNSDSFGVKGYSNQNTEGIEIIANDDNDITPAQQAAIKDFAIWHQRQNKYDPSRIRGHSEVNPGHRENEGQIAANELRENWALESKKFDEKYKTKIETPEQKPIPDKSTTSGITKSSVITNPNSSLMGVGQNLTGVNFKAALTPETFVTTNRAGSGAILDRMSHKQFMSRVATSRDHPYHDPNAQKAMNGAILSRDLPHSELKGRVHTAREAVANRQINTNGAILDRKPTGPQVKAADPNAQKNTNGAILDRKKPEPPVSKAETSSKPKDYTNQFTSGGASPSSSNDGDSIPPSESDDGSGDYGNCLI